MKVPVFLNNLEYIKHVELVIKMNIIARTENSNYRAFREPFKFFVADRFHLSKNVAKRSIKPKAYFRDSNPNVNYYYQIENPDSYRAMTYELSRLLVQYGYGIGDVDETQVHYFGHVLSKI